MIVEATQETLLYMPLPRTYDTQAWFAIRDSKTYPACRCRVVRPPDSLARLRELRSGPGAPPDATKEPFKRGTSSCSVGPSLLAMVVNGCQTAYPHGVDVLPSASVVASRMPC